MSNISSSLQDPVLIGRDSPAYPALVRGFNQRFVGTPQYVVVCRSADDVASAVRMGVTQNLRITVRCGGHCYEDFVSGNSDGIIIDLNPMDGISHELDGNGQKVICVEGGSTLFNVYNRLCREHGVTIPGGSCASVGIGGHVTGGGYGLLSRKHGLPIDYVSKIEVVTVNSEKQVAIVQVDANSTTQKEKDLFWAYCGGGGGNFGIVTKFWFSGLPSVPTYATIQTVAWDWDKLSEAAFTHLLTAYGEFFEQHAKKEDEYSGLFALFVLAHKSSKQISLTLQNVDNTDAIEALLNKLCTTTIVNGIKVEIPHYVQEKAPLGFHGAYCFMSDEPQVLPWLQAAQTLNGTGPIRRGKYKSAYMKQQFPADQIKTIWTWLNKDDFPLPANFEGLVQVDSYGANVNRILPDATAYPHRSSALKLQYQVYWRNEEGDSESLKWIRGFYEAMYGPNGPLPDDVMDGCYVSYPDVDLTEWQVLYYKENFARLQQTKRQWDPLNIFNHKQSIPL